MRDQWMQAKGLGTRAREMVKRLGAIKSVDTIVPVQRSGWTTPHNKKPATLYELRAFQIGVPTGIRTPVLTVKGWCPGPG